MLKSLFLLFLLIACSSSKAIKDKVVYQESVNTVLNESQKDIASCEVIYAKNKDLKDIKESQANLDLMIKQDGSVCSVDLVDKDLTHPDVVDCMLRKIRKMRFAKHDLGGEVEIRSTLLIKKVPLNHKGRNAKAFWP